VLFFFHLWVQRVALAIRHNVTVGWLLSVTTPVGLRV
jgi:hypothetical protein